PAWTGSGHTTDAPVRTSVRTTSSAPSDRPSDGRVPTAYWPANVSSPSSTGTAPETCTVRGTERRSHDTSSESSPPVYSAVPVPVPAQVSPSVAPLPDCDMTVVAPGTVPTRTDPSPAAAASRVPSGEKAR